MMSEPLISICIPSFNQAAYIEETIRSCMAQSYRKLEIVIVDDHSTDGTFELAQAFEVLDSRVRVLKNEVRMGVAGNWNKALYLCKGDFIKLVCADDLLLPKCVETQIKILLDHPEIALVSCWRKIIDSKSKTVFLPKRKYFLNPTSLGSGLPSVLRSGTNVIGEPACVMFRKSERQFNGEFPYLIDLDFWIQVWEQGQLVVVPEFLAAFRIHSFSLSSVIGSRQFNEFSLFSKTLTEKFPEYVHQKDFIIGKIAAFLRLIARTFIFWVAR